MNQFLRLVFLVYFITHIPITLCMDFQAIIGQYYPESLRSVLTWYITTHKDFLMENPPIWFKSFIWCEAIFQVPFFFVATYALLFKKNWIRIPGIIYGTHVATTVVPLLSEFIFSSRLDNTQKMTLSSFYFPYLLIPALFALYLSLHSEPFSKSKKN